MDKITKILLIIALVLLSFLLIISLIYFIDLSFLTKVHPIFILLVNSIICLIIFEYKIYNSIQYEDFPSERIEEEYKRLEREARSYYKWIRYGR